MIMFLRTCPICSSSLVVYPYQLELDIRIFLSIFLISEQTIRNQKMEKRRETYGSMIQAAPTEIPQSLGAEGTCTGKPNLS